jgi:autotransporter passenger strand-loop-strand repeat protein
MGVTDSSGTYRAPGQTDTGEFVLAGGSVFVETGGAAGSMDASGSEGANAGGLDISATIQREQGVLASGGSAISAMVFPDQVGDQPVFGGTTVDNSGRELVSSTGATASNTILDSGGSTFVVPENAATIGGGALYFGNAGGLDAGATTNSSGTEFLFSGGPESVASLNFGGTFAKLESNTTADMTVSDSLREFVLPTAATISYSTSGGIEYSLGGCTHINISMSGGPEDVSSGGMAIDVAFGEMSGTLHPAQPQIFGGMITSQQSVMDLVATSTSSTAIDGTMPGVSGTTSASPPKSA